MKTLLILLVLSTPSPLKFDTKLLPKEEPPVTVPILFPIEKESPCLLMPDLTPWMRPDYPWWIKYHNEIMPPELHLKMPEFYIKIPIDKIKRQN